MQHRISLAALALMALLAACGDDSDEPIPPERMVIEILRGDGFRDTVYLGGPARAVDAVVYEPVALGEIEVSPEPLVAKFGDRLEQPSTSVSPTGPSPSFATLPPNTTADWVIVDEDGYPITDGHCGRPVNTTTIPASDGTTQNFWQRPRKSGVCYMRLQGVVDGVPYVDTVFTRIFLAGPPVVPPGWRAWGYVPDCQERLSPDGDEALIVGFEDANGNATEQWRIEGVGTWIETVSMEFGTEAARRLRIVGTPSYGDTATALVYDALGNIVADMAVAFTQARCANLDTWILSLKARPLP